MVERSMPSLYLRGIGTNLGCYGSVLPGAENLGRLVALARRIEAAIGRPLETVSGGATSNLPMLLREGLPLGISELRIGEGALCARDLPNFYKVALPGVRSDAFTLRAEVIEVRAKPSHPVGERFIDAFGNKPDYEDRGVRTRLLLGLGLRTFSMQPASLLQVKQQILKSHLEALTPMAQKLLKNTVPDRTAL